MQVLDAIAERLPLPDASVDAAVFAGVLCSVADPRRVLEEATRVLRPGGELRFYEHVIARNVRLRGLQRLLDATFWPRLFGGCHTTRDTENTLAACGFAIEERERFSFRPTLLGTPVAPRMLGPRAPLLARIFVEPVAPRCVRGAERPAEQGFFGLSKVEDPAQEVHLEGEARWAQCEGRSRADGTGLVAGGHGAVGAGGGAAGARRARSSGAGGPRERRSGTPGPGVLRSGGDAGRRRALRVGSGALVRDSRRCSGRSRRSRPRGGCIDRSATDELDRVRAARAQARARAWAAGAAPGRR